MHTQRDRGWRGGRERGGQINGEMERVGGQREGAKEGRGRESEVGRGLITERENTLYDVVVWSQGRY